MQVVVNERFLGRRALISRVATWGGMAVLVLGFGISLAIEFLAGWLDRQITYALTWIMMIGGISAFNTGRFYSVRWVMRPREDEILANHLSQPRTRNKGGVFYVGLSDRFRLFNYLPQLPQVMHFLVGPAGIYVLHVRRQDGEIINDGDKWRRKLGFTAVLRSLFEGSFGNPSQDAQKEVAAVRKALGAKFSDEELNKLPCQPLIIFMDSRVKLTIKNPSVPVLMNDEVWPFFRKLQREARLNPGQLERISAALGV